MCAQKNKALLVTLSSGRAGPLGLSTHDLLGWVPDHEEEEEVALFSLTIVTTVARSNNRMTGNRVGMPDSEGLKSSACMLYLSVCVTVQKP